MAPRKTQSRVRQAQSTRSGSALLPLGGAAILLLLGVAVYTGTQAAPAPMALAPKPSAPAEAEPTSTPIEAPAPATLETPAARVSEEPKPVSSTSPYAQLQEELLEEPAPEAAPIPEPAPEEAGERVRVKRVIDGDTVVLSDGRKLRLVGMNTPERKRPLYKEATEALRELVDGEELTLRYDVEQIDQYRRSLGYLYKGDLFINGEIVRQGLAYCYTWKPNVAHYDEFVELQQEARAANRGLWALDRPAPATTYVASRQAHRFHRENCRRAPKRSGLTWSQRNEALDQGLNPCEDCDS
jgi:micrococcal nuclease